MRGLGLVVPGDVQIREARPQWVELEPGPVPPSAVVEVLAALCRALPAYRFEVVPALHVRARGAHQERDFTVQLAPADTAADVVSRVTTALEGP